MGSKSAGWVLVFFTLCSSATAQDILPVSLYGGMGDCLAPAETYPYKLERSDPLYETARKDHQRYLEEMEAYVNCLDRERSEALVELQASFRLFKQNFGKDAVFRYGQSSVGQN